MDIWKRLQKASKPILLYGMGNGADLILSQLNRHGIKASGVFASDGFIRGQSFCGYKVLSYQEAVGEFGNFIVLTAFGSTRQEVFDNIEKISNEQELYIPDAPVYGNTFFDDKYYSENSDGFLELENRLEDRRSKEVLRSIIEFKLSGKKETLFSAEDKIDELYENVLKFQNNEVIYDLGAFNGDTVTEYNNRIKDIRQTVAVEPNKTNFQRLSAVAEKYPNTFCENAVVGYLTGKVLFSGDGRNGHVNCGNTLIESITIDGICNKYLPPSFIKFDIEGAELDAVIGGEKTIKEHKPKMLISAYHRTEDLLSIPKKVLSINPDYRVFLRHHRSIPCWDTYYIFV